MNSLKNNQHSTTLLIDISDEYKVRIEDGKEFSKSIFFKIYKDAFRNTYEIVRQNESAKSDLDVYNNIIVFSGERGRGKSSSMVSFLKSLTNIQKFKKVDFFLDFPISEIINRKFASLDIIDPSLFKGEETLFEIIVAKMFSKFQNSFSNSGKEINHDDKRLVLKEFQKVFTNLKVINGGKKYIYDREPIDALSALAYGSNLYSSFTSLIDVYLDKVEQCEFLVIAIDDFDLNMADTYKMLEDIRQFLIQHKILILVSCRIEQVYQSVENNFLNQFGRLPARFEDRKTSHTITINEGRGYSQRININENGPREGNFHIDPLRIQANRYVEKLFPLSHILSMPVITDTNPLPIEFREGKYVTPKIDKFIINIDKELFTENKPLNYLSQYAESDKIGTEVFVGNNLQDVVLDLIYSKTGVFINKPTYRLNAIIPNTLRQVHSLIGAITLSVDSLSNLKNYIVDIAQNELPSKLVDIFINLEKQEFQMMNLHFLNFMGIIREHFDISNKNDFNYLLYPKNPGNVSLGDTYSVLKRFYDNVRNHDELAVKFLDYISIYLAVRTKIMERSNPSKLMQATMGGYFNGYNEVFPVQRRGGKRRDWVTFRLNQWDELSDEERYWLGFFIQFLGVYQNDYRDKKESPFFKELNSQGGNIEHAIFSPLAPLSNSMFATDVWRSLMKTSEDANSSQLYRELLEWSESNSLQSFLNNNMFYLEFLQTLDEISKRQHKSDSVGSYSAAIKDYMLISADQALDRIKEKYPYIALDLKHKVVDHPVYHKWKDMDENWNVFDIVDGLFDMSDERETFSQQDKNTARELLRNYNRYFANPQEQSPRGAKQAMNTVVKSFADSSYPREKLEEFRKLMDLDLEDGLNRIKNYLNQMR